MAAPPKYQPERDILFWIKTGIVPGLLQPPGEVGGGGQTENPGSATPILFFQQLPLQRGNGYDHMTVIYF